MKNITLVILLICLTLPELAMAQMQQRQQQQQQAQMRRGFGLQPQVSEEDKTAGREAAMVERLNAIEALLKQGQDKQDQQLILLQQQNELLNQMYQIDASRMQQVQQYQQQQQYAPAAPAAVVPAAPAAIQQDPYYASPEAQQ